MGLVVVVIWHDDGQISGRQMLSALQQVPKKDVQGLQNKSKEKKMLIFRTEMPQTTS